MPRIAHSETPKTVVTHGVDNCLAADLEEQLMRLTNRQRGCQHVFRTRQYKNGPANGLARICFKCKLVFVAFYAVNV